MITSEIIADSLNPVGNRLTTFILEYPRYIHSELMTHRVFSKNAASSRAIPIEKMIKQIQDNPAMPTHWGKNQSGMQANEELSDSDSIGLVLPNRINGEQLSSKEWAKRIWLKARDEAIENVKTLNSLGLHKQIANRILEPWFHIRIILSGTEFENFFMLRAHKDAHPDLQKLAYLMLEQYNQSEPKKLVAGEWHIPFGDKVDDDKLNAAVARQYKEDTKNNLVNSYGYIDKLILKTKIKIAIARCARVSYFNYEGKDDYEADIKLCDKLFGQVPRHLSPTEHVAQALDKSEFVGNFRRFKQFRKFFEDENGRDDRVKKVI